MHRIILAFHVARPLVVVAAVPGLEASLVAVAVASAASEVGRAEAGGVAAGAAAAGGPAAAVGVDRRERREEGDQGGEPIKPLRLTRRPTKNALIEFEP